MISLHGCFMHGFNRLLLFRSPCSCIIFKCLSRLSNPKCAHDFIWLLLVLVNWLLRRHLVEHSWVLLDLEALCCLGDDHAASSTINGLFVVIRCWSCRCGEGIVRVKCCWPLRCVLFSHPCSTLLVRLAYSNHVVVIVHSYLLINYNTWMGPMRKVYISGSLRSTVAVLFTNSFFLKHHFGRIFRPGNTELLHVLKLLLVLIGLVRFEIPRAHQCWPSSSSVAWVNWFHLLAHQLLPLIVAIWRWPYAILMIHVGRMNILVNTLLRGRYYMTDLFVWSGIVVTVLRVRSLLAHSSSLKLRLWT
jgi:hypothetical protein